MDGERKGAKREEPAPPWPGGAPVRATQVGLALLLEAGWLAAWSIALGAWLPGLPAGAGKPRAPLLPLPLILVVLSGALWLARGVSARLVPRAGRVAGVAVLTAATLGAGAAGAMWLLWTAAAPAARAGGWLQAWAALGQTSAGLRAAGAAALALLTCWRGITLAPAPERLTLAGAVERFQLAAGACGALLLLSLPPPARAPLPLGSLAGALLAVLFAGLLSLPLARVVEVSSAPRHTGGPPLRLTGPWLVMLGSTVVALLLVTLVVASVLSPELLARLLAPLEPPLAAVARTIAFIVVVPVALLVQGLIALLRALSRGQPPAPPAAIATPDWVDALRAVQRPEATTPGWLSLAIEGLLAVLLIALVALLVTRAAARLSAWWPSDDVDETRDVVGPAVDVAGLLRQLGRLRRHGRRVAGTAEAEEEGTAWRIRRCYRRFLALAARRGRARAPAETPREFARALAGELSLDEAERDLVLLTAAYEQARYAPRLPGPETVEIAEQALARLREALALSPAPTGTRRPPAPASDTWSRMERRR